MVSSLLLTVMLGAALGNVIRGVPLDADGYFFLPLWTNFRPGPNPAFSTGTPSCAGSSRWWPSALTARTTSPCAPPAT